MTSAGSSFGRLFRITTWGESHGRAVGVVVDGCPAGLKLSEADIQRDLDMRKPGQSGVSTPRTEEDRVEILSGIFEELTTGTPISMMVWNRDVDSTPYDSIRHTPRPGHADLTYLQRFGHRDHRGGGRASGRETVGRVAAGAVARKLLADAGIEVAAHCIEIGGMRSKELPLEYTINNTYSNPVRCADSDAAERMIKRIEEARNAGDSVGGIVEVVAVGVPAGLGEPVFGKLDADLAGAIMSIGSVKGVEIGAGFRSAGMMGSEMNDPIVLRDGSPRYETNNAGGIIGGISTGEPIVARAAVKPTSSISREQRTVDMKEMKEVNISVSGRHDPAIPPRICPVVESMVLIVLADHMLSSGFIGPVMVK